MAKDKMNIPQIRFKGFEGEWEKKKLGFFGKIRMCKRIFKEETTEIGDIPFYKIGTFGKEPDSFISEEIYEEYVEKYPYPEKGDILISASGTIGRTVVYNGEKAYYQDSNIVWLEHNRKKLLNEYLLQVLNNTSWNELEGSTIKRLYNNDLLNKEYFFPNIKEQTQIGNFFQKLDQVIELQQKALDTARAYKQSMLQKMFPLKGEKVPRVRFAGFSGDWKEEKLGNVATIYRGLTYKPTDVVKPGDGIRVLRSSNIDEDILVLNKDDVFVKKSAVKLENIKVGDILITAANGSSRLVGKHAVLTTELQNTVHGGFMLIARTKVPFFINSWMNTFEYKVMLQLVQGGNGAIGNLSKLTLEKCKMHIPKLEEQIQIGNFFQKLDQQIEQQAQKLATYQQLKKAMLQRMFV
ncbi:restriction endonuclease subunit S [Ignatzschineria larvae DSM 13226]|uniref:Restriction endonuclease subunit S n=1 Tax=Ignatzschineria larvae DSM 13226 TaxID=1111732 RepID=A0ABZ3BYL5_9GAMM|nr:restriction endonuclease subunit S [Ignatzschineria larvae]